MSGCWQPAESLAPAWVADGCLGTDQWAWSDPVPATDINSSVAAVAIAGYAVANYPDAGSGSWVIPGAGCPGEDDWIPEVSTPATDINSSIAAVAIAGYAIASYPYLAGGGWTLPPADATAPICTNTPEEPIPEPPPD